MSSEAVGVAAQGCCAFLCLTLQFDYLWVLLQKASPADRIFFFPPQVSIVCELMQCRMDFVSPWGNLPCVFCVGSPLLLLRLVQGA